MLGAWRCPSIPCHQRELYQPCPHTSPTGQQQSTVRGTGVERSAAHCTVLFIKLYCAGLPTVLWLWPALAICLIPSMCWTHGSLCRPQPPQTSACRNLTCMQSIPHLTDTSAEIYASICRFISPPRQRPSTSWASGVLDDAGDCSSSDARLAGCRAAGLSSRPHSAGAALGFAQAPTPFQPL